MPVKRIKPPLSDAMKEYLPIVSATIGVFALIFANYSGTKFEPANTNSTDIDKIFTQIQQTQGELEKINSQVKVLSQAPDETKFAAQVSGLNNSVNSLQERFTKIEALLVQDPTKALEVPLMRKDMETLKESNQTAFANLRQDIDRTFNLLLVSILALAVAILAPALSNLIGRKEKPQEENSNSS